MNAEELGRVARYVVWQFPETKRLADGGRELIARSNTAVGRALIAEFGKWGWRIVPVEKKDA